MSRSNGSRRNSQRAQGIEWGSKRLGDKHYLGSPGAEQKRITSKRERMARKEELRRDAG